MKSFLADVKATYDRLGRCVIAVSEGIHDKSGTPIAVQLAKAVEKDAHGNVQLSGTGALADLLTDAINAQTGIKRVRGDTFGYLQRSFLGCVSEIDRREAREVGIKAAQYACFAGADGTVTIHRVGDYVVDYKLSPLKAVAGKTKVMPDAFIAKSWRDVTEGFLAYACPLVGALPVAQRLSPENAVAKILGKKRR